jgi:hypothetical protein
MKHYRIKIRDDKAAFFEELLRYLDFLDYEQMESFSEPRIYTNFELKAREEKENKTGKTKNIGSSKGRHTEGQSSSAESLREVLAKIDQIRDQSRKRK